MIGHRDPVWRRALWRLLARRLAPGARALAGCSSQTGRAGAAHLPAPRAAAARDEPE